MANPQFVIMIVNDVHLEPNYDPYVSKDHGCQAGKPKGYSQALYGRPGCDSPYSLFISTLQKMKEVNPNPNLILVPGDIVTHSIPKNNKIFDENAYKKLKSVITNFTTTIASVYPNTPIMFSQGNDDYVLNYNVPTSLYKRDYYGFIYKSTITDINANKIWVNYVIIYRIPLRIKECLWIQDAIL